VIARFRTNIFTKNNKWKPAGNWQYTRNYVKDYGLGADARRDPPVSYPIRFNYFRLTEKAYKNLGHNLYAGMGVSFDMRNDISDEEHDSVTNTPHYQYSIDKGFDPNHYLVNGFILNVQYNTKEHPNRPFAGMYADFNIRYNTKILGSTKESGQLYTELRKYISLSQKNPEHVIALWYWGSYILWEKFLTWNCPPLNTTLTTGAGVVIHLEDSEAQALPTLKSNTDFLSVSKQNFQRCGICKFSNSLRRKQCRYF
jgi:outer membrane protein assembly factor BamA